MGRTRPGLPYLTAELLRIGQFGDFIEVEVALVEQHIVKLFFSLCDSCDVFTMHVHSDIRLVTCDLFHQLIVCSICVKEPRLIRYFSASELCKQKRCDHFGNLLRMLSVAPDFFFFFFFFFLLEGFEGQNSKKLPKIMAVLQFCHFFFQLTGSKSVENPSTGGGGNTWQFYCKDFTVYSNFTELRAIELPGISP